MSGNEKKPNHNEKDNYGMTAKQLADLYNTTVGQVWQETRNNAGNYMGMWYDSGDGKFYRD